ncbi:MAG: hypothetical protein GY946_30495, partial [bacterium]|nr:hypothetical protein [bacterium]
MSLRVALLGGLILLAALLAGLVAVVGTRTIHSSVYHEAQERANHSLMVTSALYDQEAGAFATRFGARLDSESWTDGIASKRLERLRLELDFDLLNACDPAGHPLAGSHADSTTSVPIATDPVLRRALRGRVAWGTVLHDAARLELEGGSVLSSIMRVEAASPEAGTGTDQALFQWYAWPLRNAAGRIQAIIYGGRALNHRLDLVDELHRIVFGAERYDGKPRGTITIFLGPVRVATNVLDTNGRRALGTIVSDEVRQAVLENGRTWRFRAWVVDA